MESAQAREVEPLFVDRNWALTVRVSHLT